MTWGDAVAGYMPDNPEAMSELDSAPFVPRSLDVEFKYLQNGQFVLKQMREFHGE